MSPELVKVVRELRQLQLKQAAYLDALPREFQELLFDNEYTSHLEVQRSLLLQSTFGDLCEDVEWFLYEFEPGRTRGPHVITPDGTKHSFETDEDYYTYLATQ